ncbi:hypothetical protein M9Y10_025770 [Tritrichomonas musculus]|uniref:Uncharacterized protein n=1 Tax=Tritrichomonas musculus TaxID=1915356 RepID=A0ABR2H9L7_9EUKA
MQHSTCFQNKLDLVFLGICNHQQMSLLNGWDHSAATKVSLPDGEDASSVECKCILLSILNLNGRVFTSPIESCSILKFSIVSKRLSQKIVCVP